MMHIDGKCCFDDVISIGKTEKQMSTVNYILNRNSVTILFL